MTMLRVVKDPDEFIGDLSDHELNGLASGLKHPRDLDDKLWPWAFRDPTKEEMQEMDIQQILDVCDREESDWTPEIIHPFLTK